MRIHILSLDGGSTFFPHICNNSPTPTLAPSIISAINDPCAGTGHTGPYTCRHVLQTHRNFVHYPLPVTLHLRECKTGANTLFFPAQFSACPAGREVPPPRTPRGLRPLLRGHGALHVHCAEALAAEEREDLGRA